jgi:hypothetical protein
MGRKLFRRLDLIAVVVVAVALAALTASAGPSRPDVELTAGPGGTLTISNSREGLAILSLAGMRPGDTVSDTVTIGNSGDVSGAFSLSQSNIADVAGPNGGTLSGHLDLSVSDVTNAAAPTAVYAGKLDALSPVDLGTYAPGTSRTYEFTVSFPEGGAPPSDTTGDNAFQGSRVSVQYDWDAVSTDPPPPDTEAPETTITSSPGDPSGPEVSFSFMASESGSTYECALDGGAFASCTSPKAYSALADGSHSFQVRATDAAANTDATPASHAWVVDATSPTGTLAAPGATLRGSVSLSATASDAGSGVKSVKFQYAAANSGVWKTIATDSTAPYASSWATAGVADGRYDLRVVVTDNVLNAGTSAAVEDRLVDNVNGSSGSTGGGSTTGGTGTGGTTTSGTGGSTGGSTTGGSTTGGSTGTGSSPTTGAPLDPTPESDGTVAPGAFETTALTGVDEEASRSRWALGLLLLATALLLAGLAAWRLRQRPALSLAEEPGELVFWDQRLAHRAAATVRRLTGRG